MNDRTPSNRPSFRSPRARAIPVERDRARGPNHLLHGAGLFVVALAALLGLLLVGCGGDSQAASAAGDARSADTPEARAMAEGARARTPIPLDHAEPIAMRVYSSPACGCCSLWVDHLEEHGFEVETVHRDDMFEVKRSLGVADHLASCHTGVVNGYLVEGHVPADDIRRLLAEVPDARGLAVPGMPIGSPGMEVEDRLDPYDVLLIGEDGSTTVWASYGR